MGMILQIYSFIMAHYMEVLAAMGSLLTAAQLIVRLTPTKADDGFVQRLSNYYDKIFDFLKIPNVRRDGASLGLHEKSDNKISLMGNKKE